MTSMLPYCKERIGWNSNTCLTVQWHPVLNQHHPLEAEPGVTIKQQWWRFGSLSVQLELQDSLSTRELSTEVKIETPSASEEHPGDFWQGCVEDDTKFWREVGTAQDPGPEMPYGELYHVMLIRIWVWWIKQLQRCLVIILFRPRWRKFEWTRKLVVN